MPKAATLFVVSIFKKRITKKYAAKIYRTISLPGRLKARSKGRIVGPADYEKAELYFENSTALITTRWRTESANIA
jgi:hypothetical protein